MSESPKSLRQLLSRRRAPDTRTTDSSLPSSSPERPLDRPRPVLIRRANRTALHHSPLSRIDSPVSNTPFPSGTEIQHPSDGAGSVNTEFFANNQAAFDHDHLQPAQDKAEPAGGTPPPCATGSSLLERVPSPSKSQDASPGAGINLDNRPLVESSGSPAATEIGSSPSPLNLSPSLEEVEGMVRLPQALGRRHTVLDLEDEDAVAAAEKADRKSRRTYLKYNMANFPSASFDTPSTSKDTGWPITPPHQAHKGKKRGFCSDSSNGSEGSSSDENFFNDSLSTCSPKKKKARHSRPD